MLLRHSSHFLVFVKHLCNLYSCSIGIVKDTVTLSVYVNSFITLYIFLPAAHYEMQLYQNLKILLESSVSVKLLLWAQNYCPIPMWQTQNTVRVIRVIAKPTTWKTSTVLVSSTQPITVPELRRKCSIKVQPLWKEYNSSSGVLLLFSYLFYLLTFSFPYFALTLICMSHC